MNPASPLLLLAPRMTDDSKAIWKAALDLGWSIHRIQGWRVPEELKTTHTSLVLYGEPLFAEAVADQVGLVLLEPSVNWLTRLPHEYLQRDIELMTLAEARTRPTPAFVKPADGKIFDPKVYQTGDGLPSDDQVDADIPVLRSGIVDFRLEVRCFVINRRVVTLSPYWRNDALANNVEGAWPFLKDEETSALHFADKILADSRVNLPPSCTLDVGKLPDGSWAIVEANPCWGAGLYGCDPTSVLQALQHSIIPRHSLTESQSQWVSARRR